MTEEHKDFEYEGYFLDIHTLREEAQEETQNIKWSWPEDYYPV